MGILTEAEHEYWATVSGAPLDDLLRQEDAVRRWGVTAVEFRADLIPAPVYAALLRRDEWGGPTFVAHFGMGEAANTARDALIRATSTNILGCICHSHCELADEVRHACRQARKLFAVAYH